MTLKECYEEFGGGYDDVVGRFGGERLVNKFAAKFLADKSFEELTNAMASGDAEPAFRAAHTIKGVCANLGFTKLQNVSSELTEELREGFGKNAPQLYEETAAEYNKVVSALKRYYGE